jgi:hypothetical protein
MMVRIELTVDEASEVRRALRREAVRCARLVDDAKHHRVYRDKAAQTVVAMDTVVGLIDSGRT